MVEFMTWPCMLGMEFCGMAASVERLEPRLFAEL
jgi:hypothetical protein